MVTEELIEFKEEYMTKREEIGEGIRSHLKRFYKRSFGKEPEEFAIDYLEHCAKNLEMFLASEGVVIKVDRELRVIIGTDDDYFIGMRAERDNMLKAGYVAVEPLIEENK